METTMKILGTLLGIAIMFFIWIVSIAIPATIIFYIAKLIFKF